MLKILLIKRGAMGDILMTTPLIRQLRSNFPQAIIDYCLARQFIAAVENNQYLNNVIAIDDKIFTFKGAIKFIKFAFSIRNQYDYVFLLGKNWQFNLLSMIIGGKRIGYAREKISRFFLDKYVIYDDVTRYHGLYYLDLLKASGLAWPNYNDLDLDLAISDKDKAIVLAKCQSYKLNQFIVVVNSGGNNQYESGGIRMLPFNTIIDLLANLLSFNLVVLLGSKNDQVNYAAYCKHLNYPTNLLNWAGEFSLAQSAYLISLANKVYTTDCGAMHLGVVAKLGDKMTCFFSPTSPSHVLPANKGFKIYWSDKDLFDKNYPLYGTIKQKSQKFFAQLDINKVVR